MGFFSKLVILTLAALAFLYVKTNFFDTQPIKVEKKLVVEESVTPQAKKQPVTKVTPEPQKTQKAEKIIIKVLSGSVELYDVYIKEYC